MMQRLTSILGGAVVVAVLIGGFIATEIDFGGEGTLLSRVPVAGPTLDALVPRGPGAPGPLLVLDGGGPTCGDLSMASPDQRPAVASTIGKAWRDSGQAISDQEVAVLLVVACQLQPENRDLRVALSDLSAAVESGDDPTTEICDAYRQDGATIVAALAPARAALTELGRSVSSDSDPAQTFAPLRAARDALAQQSRALRALELRTVAGRRLRNGFTRIADQARAAHTRWLGGADDAQEWIDGPGRDGAERWFRESDAITASLRSVADDPDVSVLPPGYDCGIDDVLTAG